MDTSISMATGSIFSNEGFKPVRRDTSGILSWRPRACELVLADNVITAAGHTVDYFVAIESENLVVRSGVRTKLPSSDFGLDTSFSVTDIAVLTDLEFDHAGLDAKDSSALPVFVLWVAPLTIIVGLSRLGTVNVVELQIPTSLFALSSNQISDNSIGTRLLGLLNCNLNRGSTTKTVYRTLAVPYR